MSQEAECHCEKGVEAGRVFSQINPSDKIFRATRNVRIGELTAKVDYGLPGEFLETGYVHGL